MKSLACCPIAQYAAVGTASGKVLFIDLNTEEQPRLVHQVHLCHTPVDHIVQVSSIHVVFSLTVLVTEYLGWCSAEYTQVSGVNPLIFQSALSVATSKTPWIQSVTNVAQETVHKRNYWSMDYLRVFFHRCTEK